MFELAMFLHGTNGRADSKLDYQWTCLLEVDWCGRFGGSGLCLVGVCWFAQVSSLPRFTLV